MTKINDLKSTHHTQSVTLLALSGLLWLLTTGDERYMAQNRPFALISLAIIGFALWQVVTLFKSQVWKSESYLTRRPFLMRYSIAGALTLNALLISLTYHGPAGAWMMMLLTALLSLILLPWFYLALERWDNSAEPASDLFP